MEEVYGLVAEVAPSRTTAEWVAELLKADILFGEVFSPEQLMTDPHLTAVGMFTEVDHPTEGRMRLIGFPAHSSTNASRLTRLPPQLGQHSREILSDLGLSAAELDQMAAAGHLIEPR